MSRLLPGLLSRNGGRHIRLAIFAIADGDWRAHRDRSLTVRGWIHCECHLATHFSRPRNDQRVGIDGLDDASCGVCRNSRGESHRRERSN